ncbi:threonine ammonia-lyase [Helicobacter fennelliae]|uniref:Threonine dehydratase n=3 Tax=Helicobacter TaxID=209 RepID=T1CWN7_9HELI|nr:threonine ammonia-lyase [Helicobacter fennelliae]GAD18290.1 threonine dehydratase [Helicobacter fennelliae MRY12-0050]SQB97837.1 threonine dehydratase [Helicobacter fennelliae]STP06853.1 threonine dehydratase [Helicobacter fennelliae]STQ83597.1 threonine dehydratase [Helicobacter fennelliae]
MLPLQKIQEARQTIAPIIEYIPLSFAPRLSSLLQTNIYLKKENLQRTGAFKIRGAFNKIASMDKKLRANGVIAASAGNHAQGVAYSASYFQIPAIIVMPEATPLLKVLSTKSLGAEVVLHGDNYDESYAKAAQIAKERNLSFIHPFADEEVIAGQGTIALEMIEDQDLDYVLVPIGGGGLISGILSAYKALKPHTKIIGITAKGAPAMRESFYSKQIHNAKSVRTIADGIAVRDVNVLNFSYICEGVDAIIEVDDEEIASAILYLLENQKLVVEGAGATGIAALMHNKLPLKPNDKVGVVLSGGNIDVTMLNLIIQKGLIKSHRRMHFQVVLVDKAGSLQSLTNILTKVDANIVQIDFDRTSASLAYGDAYVIIALETKGESHQKQIRQELKANGYDFKEIL